MAELDKRDVLKTIISSAKLYKKNLNGKNFLIVSKNKNSPYNFWELKFEKKQFTHLLGINTEISSKHFYAKAVRKQLSIRDFELRTDGTTELKLEVLPSLMEFADNVRMIGEYEDDNSPKLITDVLAGNIQGALGFVEDEKNDLVPNTCLNCNTKIRSKSERIVLMISKKFSESEFSKIEYIAEKNFDIEDLKVFDSKYKENIIRLFSTISSEAAVTETETENK